MKCLAAIVVLVAALLPFPASAQTPPREVRAVRLDKPIRLDGRLDDEVYATTAPAGSFVQQVPRFGQQATEPTEVWIFFDEENIYVAARCTDSHPERIVANELRRDNRNIFSLNDSFTVSFDTFHDLRNAVFFSTNPLGAVRDVASKDGTNNESWNTVWDVKAARTETGYTVEMSIPFKSLRYRGAGEQIWGINFRRVVKSKNETSHFTAIPASYGVQGVVQMALAATLVGLQTPAQSLNLELKPYAASSLTTDHVAASPFDNDLKPSAGFDAKYGLTRGLTADLTVNTDFAQVEEDQQQVNLTRFSLFFPEKRDFFLEGQGIFDFGGQSSTGGGNVPILFFSRRIGLSGAQAVPVIAGGRVTGKAGHYDIGALTVRTDDKASANAAATTFSAVRVRRDILRRSSIGAIATGRWPSLSRADSNATIGFDADLRFFNNLQALGSWSRTSTPGATISGGDASHRARFNYAGDRYGFNAEHVTIGKAFNPEVGFVRRADAGITSTTARFSPRLRRGRSIRRLSWEGGLEYITNAARTELQDRSWNASFATEFNTSDSVELSLDRRYEQLPSNFAIARGVVVPKGSYSYDTATLSYTLAAQRAVSGTVSASRGSLYGGTRTTAGYSGRIGFSAHLAIEPTLSFNWVDLPFGSFTARLAGSRVVVAPTPRLGFSSLVQYSTATQTLTASGRMRWEYTPGSELFVVYTDGRDTSARGAPQLMNRTLAIKATKLLRF